jgi:hypothetical protein
VVRNRLAGFRELRDCTQSAPHADAAALTFVNANPFRGIATANGQPAGFIGLQSYPGAQLAFRQIQIKP